MKELFLDGRLFNGTEEEFLAVEKFYAKDWKLNGKKHRDDGPAEIYSNGAEIYSGGLQCWFQNGKLHRDDGPAVIYTDGPQDWYQNGNYITGWYRWFPVNIWKYIGEQEW